MLFLDCVRLPCTLYLIVEEGGLLDFLADNLDVLINLFGFLAVEPAKIAIPIVSVAQVVKKHEIKIFTESSESS